MAVEPEEVEVDACFVTPAKQVRKVIEITADDHVHYQTRGASSRNEFTWGSSGTKGNAPTRSEFAKQVDRKVTCDWDTDYPERKA